VARITLSRLSKHYGPFRAVKDITLQSADKEFITLLGPSGCGKTTILRLIAGLLRPDAGEIRVDDRILSSPSGVVSPDNRAMGMVFQNYALWPHMTVFDNVAFGLRIRRLGRTQVVDRVERVMAMVGMEGLAHKYPGALSGGQQQRVALARSLVTEPSILLLDEPLSNLDAQLRERMRRELRELQRQAGITFVYVTHDQIEAMSLSDRVALINGGTLQQFAPPEVIYDQPANRFVAEFMGSVNILEATVDEPAGQTGRTGIVVLRNGARMTATVPVELGKGSTLALLIRPVDIRFVPSGGQPCSNEMRGSVFDRLFLGDSFDYRVNSGGVIMRLTAPREFAFGLGDEVCVHVPPDRCIGMV
jgi:iron(III) transport system ATP-binding protein